VGALGRTALSARPVQIVKLYFDARTACELLIAGTIRIECNYLRAMIDLARPAREVNVYLAM
jgi:hypothetical protein